MASLFLPKRQKMLESEYYATPTRKPPPRFPEPPKVVRQNATMSVDITWDYFNVSPEPESLPYPHKLIYPKQLNFSTSLDEIV
jgi:hypothetical protein